MLNFSYINQVKSKSNPNRNTVNKLIKRSLQSNYINVSLSIIIVDNSISQEYNKIYRNQDKPTNVISLEYPNSREQFNILTGELILADSIIKQEAFIQNKSEYNHYLHMLVHGLLHLQGYDHIDEDDAIVMEQLEIDILSSFGVSNPYLLSS